MPCVVQGAWRRAPFEEMEVEEVEGFVLAEDCGEAADGEALLAKLATDVPPPAQGD
jgi:hypothetical protein